jgi:hypothetical protein
MIITDTNIFFDIKAKGVKLLGFLKEVNSNYSILHFFIVINSIIIAFSTF